jgi:hypothetical protein
MNDILMYISLGIKIVILIILIAILLKINLMSPVKKIEKFTTEGSTTPANYCTSTIKDKSNPTCSLTRSEKEKLDTGGTLLSRDTYESDKNAKLKSITYDEIVIIKDAFVKLAADANKLTIETEQLAKPFDIVTTSAGVYEKVIDKSRIIEFVKIIGDKMDIIKKNMDDVINITDKVRYIYYYYYTSYWDRFNFSDKRIFSELYTPLNNALKSIRENEDLIKNYYLYAQGFIGFKEGTDIYNKYTEILKDNTVRNDLPSKKTGARRYSIDLKKITYDRVIAEKKNDKTGKLEVDQSRSLKDKYDTEAPTYYANYFYLWRIYDYTERKYIAEGLKPEVKLSPKFGGGIYQFPAILKHN